MLFMKNCRNYRKMEKKKHSTLPQPSEKAMLTFKSVSFQTRILASFKKL